MSYQIGVYFSANDKVVGLWGENCWEKPLYRFKSIYLWNTKTYIFNMNIYKTFLRLMIISFNTIPNDLFLCHTVSLQFLK